MGGVIATLFAIPTVKMTVEEYQQAEGKLIDPRKDSSKLLRIQLIGTQGVSYEELALPTSPWENVILDLAAVEGIVSISNDRDAGFLCNDGGLVAVRFGSSVRHITELPRCFLANNRRLTEVQIDAGGLDKITAISDFLYRCAALQHIDLSAFHNVVTIGSGFLAGCKSLERVGLSPLRHVTAIKDSFLAYCTALSSVDLTPLTSLTSINASYWLDGCPSLSGVIDLTAFRGLRDVEWYEYDEDHEFLQIYDSYSSRNYDKVYTKQVRIRVPSSNALLVNTVKESMAGYKWAHLLDVEEVDN